ncbi:hypothetical protein ANN_23660 [Periplaneta americana]|uniref:Transposase n=1 Tax=Periplaneta americana TaxID=6978 RepID=A0ABQ8SLQ2_PERAM|nr:hypothetical protein ANN_23660 [Periplaneta americana]
MRLSFHEVAAAVTLVENNQRLRQVARTLNVAPFPLWCIGHCIAFGKLSIILGDRVQTVREKLQSEMIDFWCIRSCRTGTSPLSKPSNRLQLAMHINNSERTVRRRLDEANLRSQRPATDEARFCVRGPDGREGVWTRPGELYLDCMISKRTPSGCGSIMIRTGISTNEKTEFGIIKNGSLKAARYIDEVLHYHKVPFSIFAGENFILMHDNARPHAARCMSDFLDEVWYRVSWVASMQPGLKSDRARKEESRTTCSRQRSPSRKNASIEDMKDVMFYLTTLATAEVISASPDVPEFCPAGVLLHASKSTDMSLSHLSTLKYHRPGPGSNPEPWE